jgi:hypothetical protein
MLNWFGFRYSAYALIAVLLPLTCGAQARQSFELAGLGLRHLAEPGADAPSGEEARPLRQTRQPSNFTLFGGVRELTHGGLAPAETYGGVAYAFPRGWGSSLEAGYTRESLIAPRQYALAGEVRTALSDRKALSVGIKYRVYDADPGAPGDAPQTSGYALAPSYQPGVALAPGYQVQFGYQHSAYSLFGFALGRELETSASALDPTTPYPRQLSFTALHWLTPSWAFSYDVLSGDLGSPAPLRIQGLGLRLGVLYRF